MTLEDWYDLRNQTIYDFLIKLEKEEIIQLIIGKSSSSYLDQMYDEIKDVAKNLQIKNI